MLTKTAFIQIKNSNIVKDYNKELF